MLCSIAHWPCLSVRTRGVKNMPARKILKLLQVLSVQIHFSGHWMVVICGQDCSTSYLIFWVVIIRRDELFCEMYCIMAVVVPRTAVLDVLFVCSLRDSAYHFVVTLCLLHNKPPPLSHPTPKSSHRMLPASVIASRKAAIGSAFATSVSVCVHLLPQGSQLRLRILCLCTADISRTLCS